MQGDDTKKAASLTMTKTEKVVGLFLTAMLVASSGCGNAQTDDQEDKQDQNGNGSYSGSGHSYYHSSGLSGTGKSAGGDTISTGSAAKGGIGSSAAGGGE